jgi:hypothetical protein
MLDSKVFEEVFSILENHADIDSLKIECNFSNNVWRAKIKFLDSTFLYSDNEDINEALKQTIKNIKDYYRKKNFNDILRNCVRTKEAINKWQLKNEHEDQVHDAISDLKTCIDECKEG